MEIIVSVVTCNGKYLLLQRQMQKKYPGKWEFVSSRIFDGKPLDVQARELIMFETGLQASLVKNGKMFSVQDQYGEWIIHPYLFSCNQSIVGLRKHEHQSHKWINLEEIDQFDTVTDIKKNLISLDLKNN